MTLDSSLSFIKHMSSMTQYLDAKYDWTVSPGGTFVFFATDMTLYSKKYSLIRTVKEGKVEKVLVLAKGKQGVHGGELNKKAFTMAYYLRKSIY
uniref:Uncharacterized protein n=1 Tax=Erpetoichthys calabaricus TaxID=27687 RepID=A0A8C4RR62_ERPCA